MARTTVTLPRGSACKQIAVLNPPAPSTARRLTFARANVKQVLQHVAAAGLSAILVASNPGMAAANQTTISGPARAVDGDTLVINGERIRLYGVDAPESAQQCQDAAGKVYPCGLVSKDALAKKIGSQPVQCLVRTTDQYGRNVSVCGLGTLGGTFEDLNAWLVSNGYAVAYRQYGKEYVPLEDQAHAARRGIWSGTFQMPNEWRKENKRKESGPVAPSVPFQPTLATMGVPSCNGQPPIKGNISGNSEKIYHVPGGRYYDSVKIELTEGERYFCTAAEAEAAGWRASKQ